MTTEDDFQAALDREPDNHTLRMIFADWLQERDDPRAEGYRALGVSKQRPCIWIGARFGYWIRRNGFNTAAVLPSDWFDAMKFRGEDHGLAPSFGTRHPHTDPAYRRELEDAAALAFSKLPEARRAELLAPKVEVLA